MLDFEKFIIVVVTYTLLYFIWIYYEDRNHLYIQSDIDGQKYRVRDRENNKKTVDLLAKIVSNVKLLIKHLEKMYPEDERTITLSTRFHPENITEGDGNSKLTSYSINKGEKIILCLYSRDGKNKLVDLNTILFVVIHELGHIITKSVGHTDEFWDNFKWLLEEAINIGIYRYEDYETNPVKYCGIKITSTVADKPR